MPNFQGSRDEVERERLISRCFPKVLAWIRYQYPALRKMGADQDVAQEAARRFYDYLERNPQLQLDERTALLYLKQQARWTALDHYATESLRGEVALESEDPESEDLLINRGISSKQLSPELLALAADMEAKLENFFNKLEARTNREVFNALIEFAGGKNESELADHFTYLYQWLFDRDASGNGNQQKPAVFFTQRWPDWSATARHTALSRLRSIWREVSEEVFPVAAIVTRQVAAEGG